jgi:hypothetical protein
MHVKFEGFYVNLSVDCNGNLVLILEVSYGIFNKLTGGGGAQQVFF